MKKISLIILLIYSFNANAVENKVGDFALKCSSLFFLMTMPQEEQFKTFTDQMSYLSQTMAMIAAEVYKRNGSTFTNGQIVKKRNLEADKVISSYNKDVTSALDLYARCDKFRESFAIAGLQNPNSDNSILEALVIPNNAYMEPQKSTLIGMVLRKSFDQMRSQGIDSIVELFKKMP
tara:strand:- start:264 stop:794 length:531 start_codon:yes stop_codon:yes gene_type:complete